MPAVDESERRLIDDLLLGRIGEQEFFARASLTPGEAGGLGLNMLTRALRNEDPIGVECGLYLGFHFGITCDYLSALLALAEAPWHARHEDVVDALAQLRSAASVEVLSRVALTTCPGRNDDEAQALGEKCVLALGAIQNRAALIRLGHLVQCGEGHLAAKAAAQLSQLANGWGRSRGVRGMASEILTASLATRAGSSFPNSGTGAPDKSCLGG